MSYMSSIFHDEMYWSDLPGARFATREEAEAFNFDMRFRGACTDTRVVETNEPVNAEYKDQKIYMENHKKPMTVSGPITKH